jgi:hypothetical protein
MRTRWLLLALGACTVNPGCSLIATACRDITYDVKLQVQEHREEHRYRQLADEALACGTCRQGSSPHHVRGFRDGFIDYLRGGGSGTPPPLPPRHYWGLKFQSPAGHQAIEDWYAGYREGAAAAQASGRREFAIVPTKSELLPASPPPVPPPPPPMPLPPPATLGAPLPAPPLLEQAPPPRPGPPPALPRPTSLPPAGAKVALPLVVSREVMPPLAIPQPRSVSVTVERIPTMPPLTTQTEQTPALPAASGPDIVRPAGDAARQRGAPEPQPEEVGP